jgi:putative ABC transport system permease protein
VAEALPAVAAGAAAGWGTAWALVTAVGPSAVLAAGTVPRSAVCAGVTGLAALVLTGALAAAGARGLTDARPASHRVGRWRLVPWELALVAAAPAVWLWLGGNDRIVDTAAGGVGEVAHVPARLLVAPILAIAGLAVFAARVGGGWLRARGGPRAGQRARAPGSPARLLAWRRSARVATTTAVLAVATAVPVAMAIYGATATSSIRTTADAQLRFGLGSDTIVSYERERDRRMDGLPPPPPVPDSMAGRATEVLRLNQQRLDGLHVDVLGVDPATFPAGAFWDDRIPGASLRDAADQLTGTGVPVVVASRRIPAGPATLRVHDEEIQVVVAATRPLPGAQPAYPLLLVHRQVLETRLSDDARATFSPQVWVSGEPDRTRTEITDAALPLSRVATIDQQRTGAVYEPVTYTFQYLIALSIFTGLIGAVGLLLYLESRTTAHRRAYVMLRRLGLSPRAHRRSMLLEVGAPVLVGLGAGLGAAVALAFSLRDGFDVDRRLFPGALLDLPTTMTAAVSAAAVVVAVAASLLAHARVTRANPAEVLRDTA